ncbi:alkaline phosphatase family protein [Ktedonosporobacter rubrisoli]|nr:alkaline phosphatase family protein [Ktedonosporobacter rubrisoli]
MRVLLFGIDGLAFRVLDPLIARGLLPHFQRICQQGAQGILKSTMPPMTPPAWMSISTGLLPAQHGVYDFWEYVQTEQGPLAQVVTHRKGGKAIWNILSEWGKRVIVANVPLTYPPEPVNGIMLSGYMAPDTHANITYPTRFKDELLQEVPDYQIDLDPAVSGGQIGDPLAETLKMTRSRLAMFRLLLKKPWDFCFLACSGADRIQHLCWDEIMAFHPQAVAYYQMLDTALGMMLAELGPDDLLMIISDHGFQGVRRKFYIQEHLYRQGWLQMRDTSKRRRAEILGMARKIVKVCNLQQPLRRLRSQLRRSGVLAVEKEQHRAHLPELDWLRTDAWVPSASGFLAGYADIFLDKSLTEEEIQLLTDALCALRDPETGASLFLEAHRESVYGSGPFAPAERHLILLANEDTTLPTELGRGALWETSDVTSGIHHPDGVLYLYGNCIKPGARIAPAHVCDIVPTILSFMDVPTPDGLTGKCVQSAFIRPLTRVSSAPASEGIVKQKLKKLLSESR